MHTLRATITVEMEGDSPKKQQWDIESSDVKENEIFKADMNTQVCRFLNVCSASVANIMAACEVSNPGSSELLLQKFCEDARMMMKATLPAYWDDETGDPEKN